MSISSTANIHPSSVVEDGAVIGVDVKIGPFCHVGPEVTLHDGVELISHVSVAGWTEIGDETRIFPFASIGHIPQDLKFSGERTKLEIGKRNRIREHATMNPGTAGGGGLTNVSRLAELCRAVMQPDRSFVGGYFTRFVDLAGDFSATAGRFGCFEPTLQGNSTCGAFMNTDAAPHTKFGIYRYSLVEFIRRLTVDLELDGVNGTEFGARSAGFALVRCHELGTPRRTAKDGIARR